MKKRILKSPICTMPNHLSRKYRISNYKGGLPGRIGNTVWKAIYNRTRVSKGLSSETSGMSKSLPSLWFHNVAPQSSQKILLAARTGKKDWRSGPPWVNVEVPLYLKTPEIYRGSERNQPGITSYRLIRSPCSNRSNPFTVLMSQRKSMNKIVSRRKQSYQLPGHLCSDQALLFSCITNSLNVSSRQRKTP